MPRKDSYKPEEIELLKEIFENNSKEYILSRKINNLYKYIKNCHLCPRMDSYKKLRNIKAVNLNSDVFIISQALAAGQLRLSGVNFFNNRGILGNTGKNLEKFLNKFNRTVFPHIEENSIFPQKNLIISQYIIPKSLNVIPEKN